MFVYFLGSSLDKKIEKLSIVLLHIRNYVLFVDIAYCIRIVINTILTT